MGSAATGGARVGQLRKARGISQAALARRAGISVASLSRIEIGDRVLTPGTAAALAGALQMLAEVDSAVYYLAVLHRWMDLVDTTPAYQDWAVSQQPDPMVLALATSDRVGTFLHSGDLAGGLALVDRAITASHTALTGPEQSFATGILHLRGMTLAGWLGDRARGPAAHPRGLECG